MTPQEKSEFTMAIREVSNILTIIAENFEKGDSVEDTLSAIVAATEELRELHKAVRVLSP